MSTASVTPLEVARQLVPDGRLDPATHRSLDGRGWPDRSEESWRSAPLPAIIGAATVPRPPDSATAPWEAELDRRSAAHPAWTDDGVRIVVIDGAIDPHRSEIGPLPVTVTAGGHADRVPSSAGNGTDAFELLNRLATPGPVSIEAVAGQRSANRADVHVVHLHTGRAHRSHPRLHLRVAAGAALTVVETHWTIGGGGLVNATTAIEVADGARLVHLRVLDASASGGAHLDRTTVTAGDAAEVRTGCLATGSVPSRSSTTAELTGRGATVDVTGLAVPAPGAHLDTEVSVRHLADDGTSRQHHAAVVADHARASFGGHVLVAAGTTGTDADQQARNLLLGPTARADARPWLEIDADDVACTHGATVGQIDDDALFYLRSRGIGDREARRMLVRAFADTTLDRLAPEGPTRGWLRALGSAAIDRAIDGVSR
jgi:Fe-S cluster assembly protein SufD